MAEVVAGLWAAEEAVTTTIQAGVAAYMVAKPTMPLKATFKQIATSSDDSTRTSLSRSDLTLTIVDNKAFIFGGQTAAGKLASNDIHAVTLESAEKPEPDYSVIPAVPNLDGGKVPAARTKHAACALDEYVVIFGGTDGAGETINEDSFIFMFNTSQMTWKMHEVSNPDSGPKPRSSALLLEHRGNLVLYGGQDTVGTALKDAWFFDCVKKMWFPLPDAPVVTHNATVSDGVLYAVSGTTDVSGDMHFLPLNTKEGEEKIWNTVPFPTNPLTPGPLPRTGAGLLPVTTGYGRQYLLYLFGARTLVPKTSPAFPEDLKSVEQSTDAPPEYWSDMWTCQLPSSDSEMKLTTKVSEAIKPSKIKDKIREGLGYDSGKHSWAEVEVLPPSDLEAPEGKVHPGPRSSFGYDVMKNGRAVVIWGGVNPKEEREGDGWMIRLE